MKMKLRSRWVRWAKQKSSGPLSEAAYLLAIVGGIVMIALSLAGLLGLFIALPFQSPFLPSLLGNALIVLILGVVAFIGSKHVRESVWDIALIVVGCIGGGIGGLLVLLAGLLGLLSRYVL